MLFVLSLYHVCSYIFFANLCLIILTYLVHFGTFKPMTRF